MRVLLVGFGPFPGAPRNPSAILAERLARRRRPALAATIRTAHVFATTYAAIDSELPKLLAGRPDIVLMFGLAARRRQLCIETNRAQRALGIVSGCVRIPAGAQRDCAGRTGRAPRRRTLRPIACGGASKPNAGALVT